MFPYYCIQSLFAPFRNMWKNFCIIFCKKCYEPLTIYLTSEKIVQQAIRKHFIFLYEVVAFKFWRYIQATVTCKNRHYVICSLTHEGGKNFSQIVVIKASNHLTLGLATLVMMYINQNFLQHQLCMFTPGDLQKNSIM